LLTAFTKLLSASSPARRLEHYAEKKPKGEQREHHQQDLFQFFQPTQSQYLEQQPDLEQQSNPEDPKILIDPP
jgi:hypothetical protein